MVTDPTAELLQRSRMIMLIDRPLIGQVLLHLTFTAADDWCNTAATDGIHIYYNTQFIKSLSKPELQFLLAHEVFHVIFDHIFRRGTRDATIWGMAVDYIVNFVLVKEGIGKMPKSGLYDPGYTDDYTAEELYDLLEKQQVKIKMPLDMHLDPSPNGGQQSDEHDSQGPPRLSEAEIQTVRDSMRALVLQAAQQAGTLSVGLRRLLDRISEPKIDWREMLDGVLRSAIKYDYTYTRLSRRAWNSEIVLPGQDVMDKVEAIAFLDGSASTTQQMITDFLSECRSIVNTFRDFELTVGTFDTAVYNVVVYTPENADEIDQYEFHGGGGTQPCCCWEYMRTNDIAPHRLLIFSDGLVSGDWGEQDYCDTVFIIHSNPRIVAPYGVTLHYEPRA